VRRAAGSRVAPRLGTARRRRSGGRHDDGRLEFQPPGFRASPGRAASGTPDAIDSSEALMDGNDDSIVRAAQAKRGSPFLNTEQAAFYLTLCPRRLQQMRRDATGPRFRWHGRYVRDSWSEALAGPQR
jgi:hypothetical protein